jgi:hypothetical protein
MIGQRRRFGLGAALAPVRFGSLVLLLVLSAGPAQANTFTVTNTADSGAGSLRAAILNANAPPVRADTITFNIGGAGVHTIALLSALPTINDAVTIDGTTQPGYAGTPLIELNGAGAAGADGLVLGAGSSGTIVRALAINRFGGGRAASIQGGSSGSFVSAATWAPTRRARSRGPNGVGVLINGATNHRLVAPAPPDRNVISVTQSTEYRSTGPPPPATSSKATTSA